MGRIRTWTVLGLLALASLGIAASDQRVSWRGAIILDKATGHLDDMSWSDVVWMLRPGSEIYLEPLAVKRNPFEVIQSPFRAEGDIEAGARLFRENCVSCHGEEGGGGIGGPSLRDRVFRNGRSDWALYRTIALGISGTAMTGRDMPRADIWRLVAYLDTILAAQRGSLSGRSPSPRTIVPVAADELRDGLRSRDWLTYSGSLTAQRWSPMQQIDRDNVSQLRVAWQRQFATTARVETTPLVRSSVMFVTEPPNRVHAIDAASGRVLWTYSRTLPDRLLLCCGPINRGVAILGDRIFVGTLDAHLLALDAATGKLIWDVAVADPASAYSITGAPLAIDGMVVTGVAGGDFLARGFIDAYDAASGARRWRFHAVAEPGEAGAETWGPSRGGGATWLTGSFDSEQRLIYWGIGNPSPNFYRENSDGAELYTDSVVALDADSGKLRWHFQFTPHDLHDWDAVQIPVLVDARIGERPRHLLAMANRNGFYYLLDRMTGEFVLGTPFVRQTWADGLDATGRPMVRAVSAPSKQGTVVYPSVAGATNWWSPAYDPRLQLIYVPTLDRGGIYYAAPGRPIGKDGEGLGGFATPLVNEDLIVTIKALELTTGRLRWANERPPRTPPTTTGGLLSTAGGLVFGGDNETVFALNSETGAELWHFDAGGLISAAPVTYEFGGHQFLAVAAGHGIIAFALPPETRSAFHRSE